MKRGDLVNGALVALGLLSSVALWSAHDRQGSAELEARKNKLLPRFRKEAVRKLSLTKEQRTLELVRDEASGDFRIVRPWAERADTATVNQLLGALELASALRRVDKSPSNHGHPDELTLDVSLGSESFRIIIGASSPSPPGARYAEVRLEGQTLQKVVVSQGVASELDVPFFKFRETRLLEYGRRELTRITLTSKLGKLVLEQREHGAFFFSDGARSELAEPAALERVLNALSRVSSEQFVEPDQAKAALQSDPVTVELESNAAGAAPLTLTFAAGCYQAPELATVLREQTGKSPRAGCVASDVASALRVSADDLRLNAGFATTFDAVEELSLRVGPQKLDLARKDKAWVLRGPSSRDVPLEAGNQRVLALVGARGQRATADARSLGLEPPAGELTVQVSGSDEASHREERVLIGQARADGSVCIERKLDSVRLCFDKTAAEPFSADSTLLRSVELLRFAPSELVSLSIDTPSLHEQVTRLADGSYQLQEPKGFHHDASLMADAVQTLGSLQAVRWVATAEQPSFGLTAPRLRLSVQLTTGAPRELLVGASTAGGYFARLSPDPAVFVLGALPLADLETPLLERSLCPFSRAELSRVELAQGSHSLVLMRNGDAWQAANLAPAKAAELSDALSALRAEQALHVGPPAPNEGFAKPRASISFTSQQGKSTRVTLGARGTLGDEPIVYARLDGTDATFALLARTFDDLFSF